jgi:uncharacterized repeat protein (TIGR01451 family)
MCGGAVTANAASVTVDCEGLQDALDEAETGDVITIEEGAHCVDSFFLPSLQITLQGAGSGAILDGDDEFRILEGENVGQTVIRNLTFQNGSAGGDGGAIRVIGDSPVTIENNLFIDNESDDRGGAVFVEDFGPEASLSVSAVSTGVRVIENVFGRPDEGNQTGDDGGAAYLQSVSSLEVSGNVFFGNDARFDDGGGLRAVINGHLTLNDNTFEANRADDEGGGASLDVCTASISRNVFESNVIASDPEEGSNGQLGAGLHLDRASCDFEVENAFVTAAAEDFDVVQESNIFDSNSIEDGVDEPAGGGEAVQRLDVLSTNDRYVGNSITLDDESSEDVAEGAGLAVEADGNVFEGRNLVAAGNEISGFGEGGGIYFGSIQLGGELRLYDSTVVANEAVIGPGIDGDFRDSLLLYNSIVHGNNGDSDDITGFNDGGVRDVRYSDVCDDGGPHAGEGNICADPLLANAGAGDVHQTSSSPTLNVGSDELVPGDLLQDYEGDARRISRVDMGADERLGTAPAPSPAPASTPPADIAVSKTDSPDPVSVGSNLTYTLVVKNFGPGSAPDSRMTDRLPAGVTFVSVTTTRPSCSFAAGEVRCAFGTLAVNESATVTIVVRVDSAGTLVNTAIVGTTVADPNVGNNQIATAVTTAQGAFTPPATPAEPEAPAPSGCALTTGTPSVFAGVRSVVTVRARYDDGSARAGVAVTLRGAGTAKTARTNAQGVARVTVLPKQAGRITIRGAGCAASVAVAAVMSQSCVGLSVTPKSATVGGQAVLSVRIRIAGKPAVGVRVLARGAGLSASGLTNSAGLATMRGTASRPGVIAITVPGVLSCSKRIGVSGAFLPPEVTG